jgi:C4-type Zn-finger protein
MEKKSCPLCGKKLKSKVIKKGTFYKRGIRSFECIDCGYGEYDSDVREKMILDGYFDEELGIIID